MRRNLSKRDNDVKLDLTKNANNWDQAIAAAKRGIARLELAIKNLEEMKAAGEPWPGEEKQDATTN